MPPPEGIAVFPEDAGPVRLNRNHTIAVIGGGFSGVMVAVHLLRRAPSWVRVLLIEKGEEFGKGRAYSTACPCHLLNVPAGRMSAFQDRPNDFLDWLRRAGSSLAAESFAPRGLYGEYIGDILAAAAATPGSNDRLETLRAEVVSLSETGLGVSLGLSDGRRLDAVAAVVAVGNLDSGTPHGVVPSQLPPETYQPNPWSASALDGISPSGTVLLIGTGLTMVDTVAALLDRGHRGCIHALSRRGLLPHRAAASPHPAGPAPNPVVPVSGAMPPLSGMLHAVRRDARLAEREGRGTWHEAIDRLRPHTQHLWRSLSQVEKQRFLRHLRPWWDVHRHRMPGEVAERIEAVKASGQLTIHAGRITGVREDARGVVMEFARRGGAAESLSGERLLNCTGPAPDLARTGHPLVRQLIQRGVARPDSLGLGFDVSSECALLGASGTPSARLFAVGPLTRGVFWEITAVPDIRRQCEALAEAMTAIVPTWASCRPVSR